MNTRNVIAILTATFVFTATAHAGWTPAEIPSTTNMLWLDASDASTFSDTGGLVEQWNDKSGNDAHAVKGAGDDSRRPTTGAHTINGLNAVWFNGLNGLTTVSHPFGTSVEDAFVYMVTRRLDPESYTGWGAFYSLGGDGGTSKWEAAMRLSALENHNGGGGVLTTNHGLAIDEVWMAGLYGSASELTLETWKNGSLVASKARGTYVNPTTGGIDVGWWPLVSSWQTYTDIGEFIVLNGVRDADTQQKTEGYLAWKWGLQ